MTNYYDGKKCSFHPSNPAQATCGTCGKLLCEACIKWGYKSANVRGGVSHAGVSVSVSTAFCEDCFPKKGILEQIGDKIEDLLGI